MRNLKELSINNHSCYFYNDVINLKYFHSNLLKIDKRQCKEIDIYYILYITIKKIGNCNILTVLIHFI